ncbi:outer membrane protein assembly factor, partial [Myxococcota bacterium]|nr:outer membrane protein assembly factor [Myxococcota bacterium]
QRDRYARIFGAQGAISYDFYKLSYPAAWGQGLRAALKTEYRRDTQRQLTQQNERAPFGDPTYSLSFEPTLTWEQRDSPLHPSRGFFGIVSSEMSFNSGDFGEVVEPAFKETLTFQFVRAFFKKRLIMAPQLRLGAVQTRLGEADLKSDFLFKAGGDGVSLPVRGYADASIDACGGQEDEGWCAGVFDEDDEARLKPKTVGGRAMVVGSLEARFDTLVFTDLWGAAFLDFGAVSPTPSQMAFDRLYPSVGLGLRYLVTGQIPVRLDVGLPLRETAFSPQTPRLHLNLFYTL